MIKQTITTLILVFAFAIFGYSQTDTTKKSFRLFKRNDSTKVETNLYLWGRIYENGRPLESASVKVIREGIIADKVFSDPQGYFDVKLDFGFLFWLEFTKSGYVSKFLEVDTRDIPLDDRNLGFETGDFEVTLFKFIEEVDFSIYKEPVGKIYYSFNTQQFVYDMRYIQKFKKKTDPIEKHIAVKLQELEKDEAFKLERYKVLIRDGEIEFNANDLAMARTYFEEAAKLRPTENYPKEMLAKIDGVKNAKADSLAIKYNIRILKADSAYEAKDYENAKLAFQAALNIKPAEQYPKKQIERLNVILADIEKQQQEELARLALEKKKIDISHVEIKANFQEKSRALAREFPQGVSTTEYKEGNKVITRIVVVQGNKGVEYKKVQFDWGGIYYFRNDESIPKFEFTKETLIQ